MYIIKNCNSGHLIIPCMKAYHYKSTVVHKGTVTDTTAITLYTSNPLHST